MDPERKAMANNMIFSSIVFVVSHEFRHIQAGHLAYMKNGLRLDSSSD
jgi:hypothetical protein